MLAYLARIALPIAVTVLLAAGFLLVRRRRRTRVERRPRLRSVLIRLRAGVPAPRRPGRAASAQEPAEEAPSGPALAFQGGPFLHWVPDRQGGWRLAGDYLPPPTGSRSRSRAPRPAPRP